MPTIPLHISPPKSTTPNPLPPLLHTPSGLALLDLQGTIHFPQTSSSDSTLVGNLAFPLYDPNGDPADTKWMKRVYFYVGENQRLAGEVKKLGKAVAVVRRVGAASGDGDEVMGGMQEGEGEGEGGEKEKEELEIVEVVKYRIVFSTRPEPVSGGS